MTSIAFLGTGLLGSGLAQAAAQRGDAVTVWNRTADKAQALVAFGAIVAESPAAAVRGATRVHLVLSDDDAVDDVIAALQPGLAPAAIIVDHTTTQPALTAARALRLHAAGVQYLHCPVFIGPAAARLGTGSILVAGPLAYYEAVKPALEQMATTVHYYGERPDLAAVYKLFGNAIIIGASALAADVFAMATSANVAPLDALSVLDFINPAATIAGRGRVMVSGNFAPSFELVMARKDVRLMMETAGARPLSALPRIAQRMDELIADGHGADDLAVLGIASVAPS